MFNGKVVIESFSNITKNDYSNKSEEEVKLKEEQLSLDLERVFEIGAELSR